MPHKSRRVKIADKRKVVGLTPNAREHRMKAYRAQNLTPSKKPRAPPLGFFVLQIHRLTPSLASLRYSSYA